MNELNELKKKYNEGLKRANAAEEYFKTHTVEECSKKFKVKNSLMTSFDVFNEIVKVLSESMFKIQYLTKRQMTDDEKFNGFNL